MHDVTAYTSSMIERGRSTTTLTANLNYLTSASYVKNILAASYVKGAKCVPFQSYTQGKSTGSRRLSTKVAHFVAVLLQSLRTASV